MTTIANCLDVDQALILQSLLRSNGIDSFIPDEAAASLVPHHLITKTGIRLQVADEHAQEAREIIQAQNISPT